jgi:serine/threonine protein kinase/TPR repeat protein
MNIGETYKDYYIKKKIGLGANAEVWLAEKEGADFALKSLLVKGDDGIDKTKFDKEVNSWKKANGHPNILTIHDKIIERGKFIIVLDYADGGSLKNNKFQPDEALQIIIQIISGVNHLHMLGLVHRDIKADNILLRKGIPCLGDFGLAREKDGTQTTVAISGTEHYFSPELAKAYISKKANQKLIYERTFDDDLWAVATVFYNLLTQDFPCGSLVERAERESLPADFPNDLIDFFDKAFQKEKSNRFQSAKEMLTCLKEIEQRRIEEEAVKQEFLQLAREQVEIEYRQKLDDEIISLQNKYDDEINALKERNKSFESQVLKRDSQISSWKEKIESFEDKIKSKNSEIKELESQITLLSSQSYLEKEKGKIEEKYRREFDEEKTKLKKEIASLITKKSKLESNAIVAGEELVRARNIIDDLAYERAEKVKLQEEKINLNIQLNQKNKEISNLFGQIPKKKQSKFFSGFGKLSLIALLIAGVYGIYSLMPPSYYQIANNCIEKKDFQCAINTYNEAIVKFPKNPDYYIKLGDIYRNENYEKRDLSKLSEYYRKAIEIDNKYLKTYFDVGNSYKIKNDFINATQIFEDYLKLNQNDVVALIYLGDIYSNEKNGKKNFNEALKFYDKAISINPNYNQPYTSKGDIYRYKFDDKNRNQEKAIELYKKAIEIYKEDSSAYFGLGYSYNTLGEYDEAIKNYEECNRLDGGANLNLAHIYNNQKQNYKKAKELYEKVPDTENLKFYSLGVFYNDEQNNSFKNPQEALKNFKLYLEKEKDNNDKDVVFNKENARKRIEEIENRIPKISFPTIGLSNLKSHSNKIYLNSNSNVSRNANSNFSIWKR